MRIESKFLTADVRITSVSIEAGRLVSEGLVKEALPVRVKVGLGDLKDIVLAFVSPVKARIEKFVEERLPRAKAPRPVEKAQAAA